MVQSMLRRNEQVVTKQQLTVEILRVVSSKSEERVDLKN